MGILYAASIKANALAGATTETVLAVWAGASKSIEVVRWAISFNGVTAANVPVQVDLQRFDTDGTPGGAPSVATPGAYGVEATILQATVNGGYTVEPTVAAPDILESHFITPNNGLLIVDCVEPINVPTTMGFAITCTAPNAVSCDADIWFRE